jgi:hypothetical protein
MRKKKIEEAAEPVETEKPAAEVEESKKDIKLGEFQLKENSVLLIKKTNYMGQDRIDFRVWLNSPKYKGPTRQGFQLTMDKIDGFIEMINKMKKKLEESK